MTLKPGSRYYMTEVRYDGMYTTTSGPYSNKDHAVGEVYMTDELDQRLGHERISEANLYSFELEYEGPIIFEGKNTDD